MFFNPQNFEEKLIQDLTPNLDGENLKSENDQKFQENKNLSSSQLCQVGSKIIIPNDNCTDTKSLRNIIVDTNLKETDSEEDNNLSILKSSHINKGKFILNFYKNFIILLLFCFYITLLFCNFQKFSQILDFL